MIIADADRKVAVIRGLVCVALALLLLMAGVWFGSLLGANRGSAAPRSVANFLVALPFIAAGSFLVGGLLAAQGHRPFTAATLLYFGAGVTLCLAILGIWTIGFPLMVVGGVLLLIATSVSTAPRPMVVGAGAAVILVAGGYWVTTSSPLSPRYATVAADFHLPGGRVSATAGSVPPDAIRYLVPGTKSSDGRCTGGGFSSDLAPGGLGNRGRADVQVEYSSEACESIWASWATGDGSNFSSSGSFVPELPGRRLTPTPAP